MLYPSLPQLLEKINSRYLLVNVISQRARELATEESYNYEDPDQKPVTRAIEEIVSGEYKLI
ncbi:MAG: DNA-directed RNA polymerase subunit omega [Oscillospiraceae bacterium]|jgi:DNA-directed RNA polymerase subunit omega|nr:DNA-directed RNA polymerase subunit omega [Oscillospiraceae bacterium]